MITLHWIWLVLIGIGCGCVGFAALAILSVGSATDDWNDGYQCGRDEAAEHVRAAEDELEKLRNRHRHLVDLCVGEKMERYKVDERLNNLRAERRLLRHMAGLEGEDV